MSSIDTSSEGGHKKGPGVKKAKKLSTRLDMTPMVDLGFLLITFFIFTTTMSTPKTMDLYMPKDTDDEEQQNKAKESGSLTLLLGKNNVIYYFEGILKEDASNFKTANFKEIRQIIIDKKNDVKKNHEHDDQCPELRKNAQAKDDPDWEKACLARDLVVVIKPNDEATFKNTVDILDEMTINEVKRFAMVDLFQVEKELIKRTEGN